MMIDESVVKRLAVQVCAEINPKAVSPLNSQGDYYTMTPEEMLAFANAIAAHQREIDVEICETAQYETGDDLAEAIRKQGEMK